MGLKYIREYEQINDDLTKAILEIDNFSPLLEINAEDWDEISEKDKYYYTKTLADDIFYALGDENTLDIGNGSIIYDEKLQKIKVYNGENFICSIEL
jgi:hypothetical protein